MARLPNLRFPGSLKIGAPLPKRPPPATPLNLFLELGEALEGDTHRILHALGVEAADDLIAEEGAIHTHFNSDTGQSGAHRTDTVQDKVLGTLGVMDIPGAMQHIEHLTGLRHGAKEGVITALALLLAVKPHRRALGKARGAQYRAIEIERHPGECQCHQPCDNHLEK